MKNQSSSNIKFKTIVILTTINKIIKKNSRSNNLNNQNKPNNHHKLNK